MTFNPRTLDPSQIPPEWNDVDRELALRLQPDANGVLTKAQRQQIDKIRAARWLLLTNAHRVRCGRCNQIHDYISLGCLPRPFNALHEIHLFEFQVARERGLVHGENIVQTDTTMKSLALGEPVPITRKEAQKLKLRIRARLGRSAI